VLLLQLRDVFVECAGSVLVPRYLCPANPEALDFNYARFGGVFGVGISIVPGGMETISNSTVVPGKRSVKVFGSGDEAFAVSARRGGLKASTGVTET